KDEILLEIATDKVDSEIPSPVSGKLLELCVKENEVTQIGSIVAYVESNNGASKTENVAPKSGVSSKKSETKQSNSKPNKIAFSIPEMGESVQEATIVRWLKQVGDTVSVDDNLVEIATDKVDSEVPSTVSGKLVEILIAENGIAKIGEPIAYIESTDSVADSSPAREETAPVTEVKTSPIEKKAAIQIPSGNGNSGFYTPLVRRIAKLEKISADELKSIPGSGLNKRVNKDDILNYIDQKKKGLVKPTNGASGGNFPHQIDPIIVSYDPSKVTIETMGTMRKAIAKHMVQSMYTAPHVFSIHEVNMKRIWDWREAKKNEFKKKYNFNLTLTHIIMELVIKAIQKHPRINSSIKGDQIIIHHDINLGMAVGFQAKNGDNGLIVPVLKESQALNLLGIAKKATEFTNQARTNTLPVDDTKGGTFTVTNVGVFGTEVGLGIINQPQVAILALGAIVRKPIVTPDDAIAIAPMMKMAMSYDHRVVDGMLAGEFLATLQQLLETYEGPDTI
ncbi:MAG: 2-oxo acid dehydrogenase subunit E2, partial [Calditrichaeota bacterium]|nr:2-oxo acid dehydrogenase subunit E2 [Calditrichota bacterium]